MPGRSLLHRLTAVLSSALLLQLSLVASGTLCRMHGDHSMASAESMAGMATAHAMHATDGAAQVTPGPMVLAVTDASSGAPTGPCDMTGSSCDTPWSSGGCASMTTCVTAVSAVAGATAIAPRATSRVVQVVASSDMPLGPAFAPELPPPRA